MVSSWATERNLLPRTGARSHLMFLWLVVRGEEREAVGYRAGADTREGVTGWTAFSNASAVNRPEVAGVSTGPGATAFTRTPRRRKSAASWRVSPEKLWSSGEVGGAWVAARTSTTRAVSEHPVSSGACHRGR